MVVAAAPILTCGITLKRACCVQAQAEGTIDQGMRVDPWIRPKWLWRRPQSWHDR